MKGKYPYRTKHPNFSHQLEHVGPTKQISEVQAHRICYLAPLQAPCANNRKEWQDLHKLVAKKHKEGKIQGYWLSTIYSSILQRKPLFGQLLMKIPVFSCPEQL